MIDPDFDYEELEQSTPAEIRQALDIALKDVADLLDLKPQAENERS